MAGRDEPQQVLVWQDLLGLSADFKPKFVRHYLDGHRLFLEALNQYAKDVREGDFPASEERYAG